AYADKFDIVRRGLEGVYEVGTKPVAAGLGGTQKYPYLM
ncbi:unnamed protein product, partial [marine sediment metagenome]